MSGISDESRDMDILKELEEFYMLEKETQENRMLEK